MTSRPWVGGRSLRPMDTLSPRKNSVAHRKSSPPPFVRRAVSILLGIAPFVISCGDGPPAELVKLPAGSASAPAPFPPAGGPELVAKLGCAGCHPGAGAANEARERAPSLASVGARRSSGYIFAYLADPSRARSGDSRARMPDFHLDEGERLALALYLGTLRDDGGQTGEAVSNSISKEELRSLDAALERSRKAHPEISAATGERIFASLGCAGCHALPGARRWLPGPDLSAEGSRVKIAWLRDFLARPYSVRPFGAYVGSGSRMPDFHLSVDEVDSLTTYLSGMRSELASADTPESLSAFRMREVETLLRDRLPCLGCHRLGDDGGRIGPELTNVGARLLPSYIRAIIEDPEHAAPGTVMPRVPLPPRELGRLVAYLASLGSPRGRPSDSARAGYLSLVDHVTTLPVASDDAAALYGRICSNCHGPTGGGNGWNAAYLPVRPTAHADAKYMSTRTDHTLYDGIAAGGYILDRSNRMPPFGETLDRAQIQSLVNYIRKLCDCEGPEWSRDGAAR